MSRGKKKAHKLKEQEGKMITNEEAQACSFIRKILELGRQIKASRNKFYQISIISCKSLNSSH